MPHIVSKVCRSIVTRLLLIGLTIWSISAVEPSWSQTQKLTAAQVSADLSKSVFGGGIALSGDTAVLGSPSEYLDADGLNPIEEAGAAHIFKRDATGQWREQQRLVAERRGKSRNYGSQVFMDDGDVVIAQYGAATEILGGARGTGDIEVFRQDRGTGEWRRCQRIETPSFVNLSSVYSMSCRGGWLMVGTDSTTSGDLWIYRRDPVSRVWKEHQILKTAGKGGPIVASTLDQGFAAITISGGGKRDNAIQMLTYDPSQDTWAATQILVPNGPPEYEVLGHYGISLDGEWLAVGAVRAGQTRGQDFTDAEGAVYVFHRNVNDGLWSQYQKLMPNDRMRFDMFGKSVCLRGDRLFIGAAFITGFDEEHNWTPRAGTVYEFGLDPVTGCWTQRHRLVPPDGWRTGSWKDSDRFGSRLGVDGDTVLIGSGAALDATGANPLRNAGAVYAFSQATGNHVPSITGIWTEQTPSGIMVHVRATDADGDPLTYAWKSAHFSDGYDKATFVTPQAADSLVTFSEGGASWAFVTVTDGKGGHATAEVPVMATTIWVETEVTQVQVPEGGSATLRMRLRTPKNATVYVGLAAGSGSIGIVGLENCNIDDGPTTMNYECFLPLTFTTANWDQWQTVTLTAPEDGDTINSTAIIYYIGRVSASDRVWGFVTATEVDHGIRRDGRILADRTTVGACPNSNSTVSFQVKLDSAPTTPTTVSVAATGSADLVLLGGQTLTFTPDNWDLWQPVVLACRQDVNLVNDTATITCSASGWIPVQIPVTEYDYDAILNVTATAGGTTIPSGNQTVERPGTFWVQARPDPGFRFNKWTSKTPYFYLYGNFQDLDYGIKMPLTTTTNFEVQAEFIPISATQSIETDIPPNVVINRYEGSTHSVLVRLTRPPSGDVTVTTRQTAGTAGRMEVLSGSHLVFSPTNWQQCQTVVVKVVDDQIVNGDDKVTFTCSAPGWDAVTFSFVARNNDTPAQLTVTAAVGGTTVPSGLTNVVSYVRTPIQAIANPGYTFVSWTKTVNDYNVTLLDDQAASTSAIITSGNYNASATVQANFLPNSRGLVVDRAQVEVPEGGTASFQVNLASAPSANLVVAVRRTGGDASIAVDAPTSATMTFTPTNWNTFQTVTLKAYDDYDTLAGRATVICSAEQWISAQVEATEIDNETTLTVEGGPGGTVSPSGPMVVGKGAATPILATPMPGGTFVSWRVVAGEAVVADPSAASSSVTINGPATVTADFTTVIRKITMEPLPGPRWWEAVLPFVPQTPANGKQEITGPANQSAILTPEPDKQKVAN